jgi:hypothetical protein
MWSMHSTLNPEPAFHPCWFKITKSMWSMLSILNPEPAFDPCFADQQIIVLSGDGGAVPSFFWACWCWKQVRFNDPGVSRPHFDTMQIGKDNAIARHGIHGLYHLFSIAVSPRLLREGENVLYLTQRKATGIFTGVMYDYLRLEEPSH